MAVQCILITGLKYVWEARLAKKVVTMYRMRAKILRKQDLANHINRVRVIKVLKESKDAFTLCSNDKENKGSMLYFELPKVELKMVSQ